jgi:hypothetical protein
MDACHRLAMVLACGCSEPHPNGQRFDAPGADSPSPACDVYKPFGAPTLVDGINTSGKERWGWQTADERTIYFASATADGNAYDLVVATRPDPTAAFAAVSPLATVNTVMSEARPILTGDGLTLYMETVYSTDIQIEVSTRADLAAPFSSHSVVPVVDTSAAEFNPWISEDGLVLYFTSDRDGFNDIFKSERATLANDFSAAVAVTELNSQFGDYMGALSRDGLEVFIGSSRDTNLANGDIFHATREAATAPFDPPTKLSELSDPSTNEYPSWVSADRCRLLLFSDRAGSYDLWMSSRPQ